MEKRKVFNISIIDKEIIRTELDRNTFYTSDSELTLVFKLIERDYNYDHGEILLYNKDDESFVTREINKQENDFVYEIESDIITHYGTWKAQLQLIKDGDVYTSKLFEFTIENDLSNLAPQPTLIDISNWTSLKQTANELIDEMQDIIVSVEQAESGRVIKENTRQQAESERENKENHRQTAEAKRQNNETVRNDNESQRQSAEAIRVDNENQRVLNYENMKETIDSIGKVKLVNDIDVSITANGEREITKAPELTQKDDKIINYLKNDIIVGDKYYISIEVKTKGIGGRMFFYSGGGGGGNYVSLVTSDEYNLASKIVTGASNFVLVRIANITGQAQATGLVYRNVYTINLTKTFGAGNEPSKEVMDWIISGNEYFDELLINRDDLQQYEINQLRKAVIALGGTI